LQCRNCGDVVDPRRVELGYDYCLKEECQQRCLKRVHLAAVGVNKAADYYMKAEEVLPPRPAATTGTAGAAGAGAGVESPADVEYASEAPPARPKPVVKGRSRPKTTLERLREQEQALDAALDRSYERFRRGEVTATEMHRERDRLVEAFDRQVMRENIRYRSMLRGPAHRAG
jgi:hypothetical protein